MSRMSGSAPSARSRIRRAALAVALSAIGFSIGVTAIGTAASLKRGDFILLGTAGYDRQPVLMKLDGTTLDTTRIATSGLFQASYDVAVTTAGRIVLAHGSGVVEVDPGTGSESVVLSTGALGGVPHGISAEASGSLFISIGGATPRILRWAPPSGLTEVTAGGLLDNPGGLELGPDGMLYVANTEARVAEHIWYGKILRVDPGTGAQTLVSQDPALFGPFDLTFGPDGFIWTANQGWLSGRNGCHVRTDPVTGACTTAGLGSCRSMGLARGADGRMLLSDCATIGPDCNTPVVGFSLGSPSYGWLGGKLAVVPNDVVTPTSRSSWGRLKAIYR